MVSYFFICFCDFISLGGSLTVNLELYMWEYFEAWDFFLEQRYSPDSLSQIQSFSLCVCCSVSVSSGCHSLRGQAYHDVFSREYFSPSAQDTNDDAGFFLEVLCGRMRLFLALSTPQAMTFLESKNY